jgi:hypothetical protein
LACTGQINKQFAEQVRRAIVHRASVLRGFQINAEPHLIGDIAWRFFTPCAENRSVVIIALWRMGHVAYQLRSEIAADQT